MPFMPKPRRGAQYNEIFTCRKGEQEVKSRMGHEDNTTFKASGKYLDSG